MKTKICITLFTIICFVSVSCNKQTPVPGVYFDYCGLWGSANYSIEIWEDGDGSWEYKGYSEDFGNVTVTDKQIAFYIGQRKGKTTYRGGKTTFSIDKAPFTDTLTGRRQMVLSGETFYKN